MKRKKLKPTQTSKGVTHSLLSPPSVERWLTNEAPRILPVVNFRSCAGCVPNRTLGCCAPWPRIKVVCVYKHRFWKARMSTGLSLRTSRCIFGPFVPPPKKNTQWQWLCFLLPRGCTLTSSFASRKQPKKVWKEKPCRLDGGQRGNFAAGAEKTNVIHHTD